MLEPKVPIAEEGYPFIGYTVLLTILSAVAGFFYPTVLLLVLTTFVIMFFRDPERMVPEEQEGIISPADGKVIIAEMVKDIRFSDGELLKVSIFMNVFNVHVNRIPASGKVTRVRYVPGKFLAADHDQAHLKNEYCAVTMLTDQNQELTFVQIAGLIARRIVCWLEPGDTIIKGRRFGLIRFGSRVDLYLPPHAKLHVHVGHKVRAGESVLATIEEAVQGV